MIQSSRSIQGPSAESGVSPGVPGRGNKLDKTGKKGKTGAFARLLEGLSGKLKKTGEGAEGSLRPGERPKRTSERVPGEKGGAENNLLAASFFLSPESGLRGAPKVEAGGIFPAPEGVEAPGEAPAPWGAGLRPDDREEAPPPAGKAEGAAPAAGEGSGELRLSKAAPSSLFASLGSSTSGVPSGSGPEAEAAPGSAGPGDSHDPPKPAFRGAVDLFSGSRRRAEIPDFQFSGLPRPALVDTLNPKDRVREKKEEGRLPERPSKKPKVSAGAVSPSPEKPGETLPSPSLSRGPESALSAPQGRESEINVDLGKAGDAGGGRAESPGQGKPAFEQALARELGDGLNYDIVREAQILLRGGGVGTIRLSLRPETLGNIKIRLEMAENKIKGHIIVESGEALRAFKQELASLEQAFRDSGFSDARLDMSLAQGGGGEGWRDKENPRFDPLLAASRYDEGSLEGLLSERDGGEGLYGLSGTKMVNLLI